MEVKQLEGISFNIDTVVLFSCIALIASLMLLAVLVEAREKKNSFVSTHVIGATTIITMFVNLTSFIIFMSSITMSNTLTHCEPSNKYEIVDFKMDYYLYGRFNRHMPLVSATSKDGESLMFVPNKLLVYTNSDTNELEYYTKSETLYGLLYKDIETVVISIDRSLTEAETEMLKEINSNKPY